MGSAIPLNFQCFAGVNGGPGRIRDHGYARCEDLVGLSGCGTVQGNDIDYPGNRSRRLVVEEANTSCRQTYGRAAYARTFRNVRAKPKSWARTAKVMRA